MQPPPKPSRPAGFRRIVAGAVLVLLLSAFAFGPVAADAKGPASPEAFFFRVSRVQAVAVPAQSATSYTVTVTNAPAGNAPYVRWYLELKPSASSAPCTNAVLSGGTPLTHSRIVWKNQGPTFVWYHGAKGGYASDRSYGCDQAAIGHAGYPGTVTAVFENDSQHCTATFAGTSTGAGPTPVCALGGYLPLPVPHPLLQIYTTVDKKLTALIRQAQTSTISERSIDAILKPQTDAFTLFPPIWGCRFDTVFNHVLQVRSALGAEIADAEAGTTPSQSTLAANARNVDAMASSLRACKPSPTRPVGVPSAVIQAVDGLGDKSAALASQAADRTALETKLLSLENSLGEIVKKSFPPVFGMPYGDLVDRVLAENSAVALADQAAGAGRTKATASALAHVAGHEQTIGHALHTEAQRAGKAEAAS